jgi:glyoxylase-like metal-dependent hydrolase (beta-lactamase superfamily II)
MPEIAPDTVSDRLAKGDDLLLVDIRREAAFEDWHIPGSENVDVYDELTDDPESAADALASLPRDREIVTVCAAGKLSAVATELLQEMGYDAKTLVDGMNGWSRVHRSVEVSIDVPGTLLQVTRPGKGCLSHVLISEGEAAVFDPSMYVEEYESVVADRDAAFVGVFDTHAHADHVSGGRTLADEGDVPYYLHPADAHDIDATPIAGGQSLTVGSVEIEVVHTPGHSPGSVSFDIGGAALVTGDTLFHESVGRVELGVEAGLEDTDVEENAATLYESLQRLLDRPGDPLVLPAHDPGAPEPPVVERLSDVVEGNADLRRDRTAFVRALTSDIPEHPPNFQRVKQVNVGAADVPDEELSELERGPNRCAAE